MLTQMRLAPLWADRLATFWAVGIALLLFALFQDRAGDDPYITYRYSANIARGAGFVYNEGERVLSTTTPLYALLLAGPGALGLPIPLVSNALGCVGAAAAGLALWRLGRQWQAPLVGTVGLLLTPLFPLLITILGAESNLYLALVLWGLVAYAARRYTAAALLLALATLTRADGMVAVGLVAAHFGLVRREPIPWRAAAMGTLPLVAWYTFAWAYFGTLLPVTLAAKQQQGTLAASQSFAAGFPLLLENYWRIPLYRLHFGLGLLGLLVGLRHWPQWSLVLAWSALYFMAYTLLGVTRYVWYYAPLVPSLLVLVGLGVESVHRFLVAQAGPRRAGFAAALLLLLLLVPHARSLANLTRSNDPRSPIYRAVGSWLQTQTAPDATIATLEIGLIGYYAQRHMIDFAGLLQPDVARQLTPGGSYEEAALWATHQYRPDFLVLQVGLFPRLEQQAAVLAACRVVHTFADDAYPHAIAVHQCSW